MELERVEIDLMEIWFVGGMIVSACGYETGCATCINNILKLIVKVNKKEKKRFTVKWTFYSYEY